VGDDDQITPDDADELADCFAACAREIFGHACALARGDREQAGDLVQAAFQAAARAWPGLGHLADEQRRGWLRTTVEDIAVRGLHGHGQTAVRGRPAQIEVRSPAVPAGSGAVAFTEITLERCWQLIGELPERQHPIALMCWQLDMKDAEIAAVLGIAEQSVRETLDRVGRKLIALLGPDDHRGAGAS
jgi:RNA polymerase sigma-70 factor, ECF subfamily